MTSAASTIHTAAVRWLAALALAAWSLLSGCAALPSDVQRAHSEAIADVAPTPLAQLASSSTPDDQCHLSGLRLLPNGPEALATRIALARRAQKSLDVQILRLRRKIEVDPAQPQFIKTERGAGYLFAASVELIQ